MLCLSHSMASSTICLLLLVALSTTTTTLVSSAAIVGVNYGQVANNLPDPYKVVQLLKSQSITQIKLYDANPAVLRALAGTSIKVVVALPNEQLAAAAARPNFALSWVQRNVAAFTPATHITAVAVGNEVFADPRNLTAFLVPAMQNVHTALTRLKLDKIVKVSSPVALTALSVSYPSSAGAFRADLAEKVMTPMLELLRKSGSYLMVNAYPYFAYESNSDVISLDYALFRPNVGVVDAGNGLRYYNLLDAQLDAVFAALTRVQYGDVRLVVSETGWPSKGDAKETGAGAENAAAYNGNLVRRVLSGNAGTPLKPSAEVDVYLFALFNENQKPGPTSERNYGLFYPSEEKVYDVGFTQSNGGKSGGGLRWQEERGRGAPTGGAGGKVAVGTTGVTWCVADTKVGEKRLQAALDYACGEGGADCRAIQDGKECYDPNTLEAHASYAFNSYYQKKGRVVGTCDFEGAGFVVSQAPKVGKCVLSTTGS